MDKLNFLKNEFPQLLKKIDPAAKGSWGVMNGQQMAENLEKFKAFALSEKDFKPNTKNALMSETPHPITKSDMKEAVWAVENEIRDFIYYFENDKGAILTNPFFGDLNFEEWTHLLHKHAVHHCKQFGLIP